MKKSNLVIEYKDGEKVSINSLGLLKDFMSQAVLREDKPEDEIIKELKAMGRNFGLNFTDEEFMKEYRKVKKRSAPMKKFLKNISRHFDKNAKAGDR